MSWHWLRSPQFMWAVIAVAAGLGWLVAGVLGSVVVLLIGLLAAAQRQVNPLRNWRTGRPWRSSRAVRGLVLGPGDQAGPGPGEPGVVQDWIRERSLYDPPDDSTPG
ncbi:MAG TPA: hypothetical protein VEL03_08315 [Streptosporangiaceae bacterium]|nr:hypothetical protein [Streptosporangiaceae bacterium]